ncbi:TPA: YkgJ family cysteine cluster protein [Escherichia coli]|nr:YkgJ family cysteine cluster protein [Escherichia coli]
MKLHPPFPCSQCGACCCHVNRAGETQCLDRGDGICRHYQTDSHLCAIYDKRPQICRVEDQYLLNYQSQYSWQEFIALNQAACLILNKL